MTASRRKFTPEEKSRIVLEILKEEKSVSQLASEHGIHVNVLNRWKSEAVQNLSQLFVDDRKALLSREERIVLLDWDYAELPNSETL
jgi:putative transposase